MIRPSQRVLLGALALTLVVAPSSAKNPPPSGDFDDPARTPYWASATVTIPSGFAGVLNSPVATIAENQRLVIEQVSVRCGTQTGNIVRVDFGVTQRTGPSSSTTRTFSIPVGFQGDDPFAGQTFVGGISSRMYSDAGILGFASVTGGVIRDNGTETGFCAFAISGYTITI